jgi:hypothetical protein
LHKSSLLFREESFNDIDERARLVVAWVARQLGARSLDVGFYVGQ